MSRSLTATAAKRLQVLAALREHPELRLPDTTSRATRALLVAHVAERCGVSTCTVRRCLADDRPVEQRAERRERHDRGHILGLPEPLRSQVELRIQQLHDQSKLLLVGPRGGVPRTGLTATEITRQLYAAFPQLDALFPRLVSSRGSDATEGPVLAVADDGPSLSAVGCQPSADVLPYHPRLYGSVNRFYRALVAAARPLRPSRIRVEAPHINYQWVKDETTTDFFLQPGPGETAPQRVILSVVADEFSRSILYAQHIRSANRGAWSELMIRAIGRKAADANWPMCGVPHRLRYDVNYVDFSAHAKRCMADLGIAPKPCIGYQPQTKGKVERLIGVIKHELHPLLPGFCGAENTGEDAIRPGRDFLCRPLPRSEGPNARAAVPGGQASGPPGVVWLDPRCGQPLLTTAQADAVLHQWIGEYHGRVHSALGRSPRTAWIASMSDTVGLVRVPTEQQLLETFLIQADDTGNGPGLRTVRRQSVQLSSLIYQADLLADFEGVTVDVRYCPTDTSRVWIFHRGQCLGEAPLLPTLVLSDDLDFAAYARLTRDNKRRERELRELLQAAQAGLQTIGHPLDRLSAAGATRGAGFQPAAPGGDLPWSPPEDDELAGLSLGGIALAAGDR